MTYVLIRNGLVVHCVSVDDLASLHDCYPDCVILERTGEETTGWTYDGVSFSPPQG